MWLKNKNAAHGANRTGRRTVTLAARLFAFAFLMRTTHIPDHLRPGNFFTAGVYLYRKNYGLGKKMANGISNINALRLIVSLKIIKRK